MTDINKYEPPQRDAGDVVYAAGRVAAASIPLVGAGAVELLQILSTLWKVLRHTCKLAT